VEPLRPAFHIDAELVAIVGLGNETNRHAAALDLQIDPPFAWPN
jgi:hypothetical protein